MGLGDMLGGIFGGGNDYKYTMPPTMGPPRRPGESDQDYQNRIYAQYQNQANQAQQGINQAADRKSIPTNLLNYSAANKTLGLQSGLANQLLAQGRGEGPNPAMDQLRMTTDQNARQGAAMAASQRGINPALAARLAGQNVASANQQAAGQGALMSAQQQLGAQQAAGNLLGNISGQQIGMSTAQGQAGLGLLSANAQLENLRRQAELERQNQINSVYGNANAINAGVSAQNAATAGQYGMGAMSGISSMLGGIGGMFNKGGEVPNPFLLNVMRKNKMYDGGVANFSNYQQDPMGAFYGALGQAGQATNQAGSNMSKDFSGLSKGLGEKLKMAFTSPTQIGGTPSLGGLKDSNSMFSLNGAPKAEMMGASLGVPSFAMSQGGKIDGKAKVKGDSESNDVVPAMLSPGEVVIPRSAMGSPEDAHAFLDNIIRKHEGPDYRSVRQAQENYHNMAHGGDIALCMNCGGYV